MRREVALKMLDVGERLLKSESYCRLLEEYRRLDTEILKVFEEIQPHQKDVLMAYMSMLIELHRRLLEEACSDV